MLCPHAMGNALLVVIPLVLSTDLSCINFFVAQCTYQNTNIILSMWLVFDILGHYNEISANVLHSIWPLFFLRSLKAMHTNLGHKTITIKTVRNTATILLVKL